MRPVEGFSLLPKPYGKLTEMCLTRSASVRNDIT